MAWLLLFCVLGFSPTRALPTEDDGPVRTLPLGLFTVYAAEDPFRLSWFYRDELLLADRYRRHDSALEVLQADGWSPLGRLVEARAERGGELGESRWRLRVVDPDAQETIVVLSWSPTRASARVSCTRVSGEVHGWREDFVAQPDERTYGVSDTTFTQLKPLVAAPRPDVPEKLLRTAVSSRGFGLIVDGRIEQADLFRPDPDAWRVQVSGSALGYSIVPGSPKAVLRARARRLAGKADVPRPGERPEEFVFGHGAATSVALRKELSKAVDDWLARWERSAEGLLPVPLGFEFPRDSSSWSARDAWALGAHVLLVARPRSRERLHLPSGRWLQLDEDLGIADLLVGANRVPPRDDRGGARVFVRQGSPAEDFLKAALRSGR